MFWSETQKASNSGGPELFLNLQLGLLLVVLKVHIPAPVRSWGVLEFILGIWNSNYIAWKITQAYECEWHTFFVQRFRALVSSSQVQGNSSNWVCFYSFSSLPSASRTPSLVVSWPLPLYLSFNPSVLSFPTWVESCHHLLGKYTLDVYFLPFAPPYFIICYVMYIGVPFAINASVFSLGDRSRRGWSDSWVWAAL